MRLIDKARFVFHNLNIVLSPFELSVFYIFLVSLSAIFLLAIGKFTSISALSISFALLFLSFYLLKVKINFKEIKVDYVLLGILLIGLIFRWNPYLYLLGGQDQGTYVNISKQYQINGKIFAFDAFRNYLTTSEQKIYDEYGNYLMPSIEKWNRPDSEYSMLLYPLHPAWMAIFADIFGDSNRVYSNVFFSTLSLYVFFLLGYEITKNKLTGYLFSLLMAVHPLASFFAKFPVTETLALFFTSVGFYFVIKFYNKASVANFKYYYLFLSLLSWTCFFYTRLSFILYIPFFIILVLSVLFFEKSHRIKFSLLVFLLFFTLSFWISLHFFKTVQYPLYLLIFEGTINDFLSFLPIYKFSMFISNIPNLIIFILFIFLVIRLFRELHKRYAKRDIINASILLASFLVLLYVLYRTYVDIHSMGYVLHPADDRWKMYGTGLMAVKYMPITVVIEYVCPLFFLLFPIALYYLISRKKDTHPAIIHLSIFVILFLLIDSIFLRFFRYAYYDVRYFYSELIPYFILFICIFLSEMKQSGVKYLYYLIFLITFAYFSFFSSVQFFGREMGDLHFYNELTQEVGKRDLLVVYKSQSEVSPEKYSTNFNYYVLGPLKYYYNRNILILRSLDDLKDPDVLKVFARFDKAFLISDQYLQNNPLLTDSEKLIFVYQHFNNSPGCYIHTYEFLPIEKVQQLLIPYPFNCFIPPNAYYTRTREYFLYKINMPKTLY